MFMNFFIEFIKISTPSKDQSMETDMEKIANEFKKHVEVGGQNKNILISNVNVTESQPADTRFILVEPSSNAPNTGASATATSTTAAATTAASTNATFTNATSTNSIFTNAASTNAAFSNAIFPNVAFPNTAFPSAPRGTNVPQPAGSPSPFAHRGEIVFL